MYSIGLGLGRALKAVATAPLAIRVMNAMSGRQITPHPLGETAIERYGAPYLSLHRADLLQVLAGAAADHPDIAIHMGRRVESAASHVNGVTSLVYDNGALEEFQGLALIAADGVWSKLRKLIFETPDAAYTGMVAWRGLIPMDILQASQDKENIQLWLAPDAHAVSYPVRQGRYFNFVAVTSAPSGLEGSRQGWADEANAEVLVGELSRWHRSVLDTLESPRPVDEMAALRGAAACDMVAPLDCALRRCRPCDAAIFRARRRHGHRRCSRTCTMPGRGAEKRGSGGA